MDEATHPKKKNVEEEKVASNRPSRSNIPGAFSPQGQQAENPSISFSSWLRSNVSEYIRVSLSNSTYLRRRLIRIAQLRRLQKLDRKSAKYLHFDPDMRTNRAAPMVPTTPPARHSRRRPISKQSKKERARDQEENAGPGRQDQEPNA